MASVTFRQGDSGPITRWDGKIAFPDRKGPQPVIGDSYEVVKAVLNPRGTVYFLQLGRNLSELRRLEKAAQAAEAEREIAEGRRRLQAAADALIAAGVRPNLAGDLASEVAVWGENPHEIARWANRAADIEAEWLRRFEEIRPSVVAAYEAARARAVREFGDAPYGINGRTPPVRYRFGRYHFRRVLYPAWMGSGDSLPSTEAIGVPPMVRKMEDYLAGRIASTAKRVARREAGLETI